MAEPMSGISGKSGAAGLSIRIHTHRPSKRNRGRLRHIGVCGRHAYHRLRLGRSHSLPAPDAGIREDREQKADAVDRRAVCPQPQSIGLPLGRTIGLLVGWRAAFLIIAAIAAIIFCILAAVLKKTPSDSSFSLRKLPALIKSPALLGIFLLTLVTITGHFTAYSYIEPFLGQVAGFGDTAITMILAMFGVVGIAGSIIFSGRHLGGNVHLLRNLQHRHRHRSPHRRISLLRDRDSLHRLYRRGDSIGGRNIFYQETDAHPARRGQRSEMTVVRCVRES